MECADSGNSFNAKQSQFGVFGKRGRVSVRAKQEAKTQQEREVKMKMTKANARREMRYGFCSDKNEQGQVDGSAVVRLPQRNAYGMVGLRRPPGFSLGHWRSI